MPTDTEAGPVIDAEMEACTREHNRALLAEQEAEAAWYLEMAARTEDEEGED